MKLGSNGGRSDGSAGQPHDMRGMLQRFAVYAGIQQKGREGRRG